MKWLHCDEWYCWGPADEGNSNKDFAKLRRSFPHQYAFVPNELATRFEKAFDAFAALQSEVQLYAGRDR